MASLSLISVVLAAVPLCVENARTKGKALTDTYVDDHIWHGTDVTMTSWSLGPFPAFVALVAVKNGGTRGAQFRHCGASLYRRQFLLTAAHCLTGVTSEWEIHGYLNAHRNPAVLELLFRYDFKRILSFLNNTSQADEELDLPADIKAFRADVQKGVGVPLVVRAPREGAQYGLVHSQYSSEPTGVTVEADVAVLSLVTAPFPDNARIWAMFDIELADNKGRAKTSSGMAYGNGLVDPADARCGGTNCILQEKGMRIMSYDQCLGKWFHNVADVLANVCSKDGVCKRFRDAHETFTRMLSGGAPLQTDDHALLKKLTGDLQLDLEEVRKGTTLCVMSHDESGNIQKGDSGGPLASADGGTLLGIASQCSAGNGNYLAKSDGTRIRMPGYYASVAWFKSSIDAAIDCLVKQGSDDVSCRLG